MKSVLISIKPKWCGLIASRKKTVEVRKTCPKLKTPFKCYICCTKTQTVSDYFCWCGIYGKKAGDIPATANGKVIGEFVCDKIEAKPFGNGVAAYFSNEVETCMSDIELLSYAVKGKPLYFWHISDLKIYDEPKELGEFRRHCDRCSFPILPFRNPPCDKCPGQKITNAPQSWCYVEETTAPYCGAKMDGEEPPHA